MKRKLAESGDNAAKFSNPGPSRRHVEEDCDSSEPESSQPDTDSEDQEEELQQQAGTNCYLVNNFKFPLALLPLVNTSLAGNCCKRLAAASASVPVSQALRLAPRRLMLTAEVIIFAFAIAY